ncbi:hypothetical protein D3C87_1434500 [compost metagenome]
MPDRTDEGQVGVGDLHSRSGEVHIRVADLEPRAFGQGVIDPDLAGVEALGDVGDIDATFRIRNRETRDVKAARYDRPLAGPGPPDHLVVALAAVDGVENQGLIQPIGSGGDLNGDVFGAVVAADQGLGPRQGLDRPRGAAGISVVAVRRDMNRRLRADRCRGEHDPGGQKARRDHAETCTLPHPALP